MLPLFAALAQPQCRKHFPLKLSRSCRRRRRRPQQMRISVLVRGQQIAVPALEFRYRGKDIYQFPSRNCWMPLSPPCSPHKRRPINFFLCPSNSTFTFYIYKSPPHLVILAVIYLQLLVVVYTVITNRDATYMSQSTKSRINNIT